MLSQILRHINNYFVSKIIKGDYKIAGGTIAIPNALAGQYVRIVGSVLNDGVYLYPLTGLTDEEFSGEVWILEIPKDFLDVVKEITDFQASDMSKASPYTSESFGGYSYSKGTNAAGVAAGWQEVFRSKLNDYRKM